MRFHVLALAFAVATASESNTHAHGHGRELCGCAKDEPDHPFTLDCSNAANIRAATTTLTGPLCAGSAGGISAATCSSTNAAGIMECQAAFFVLQAHHDYCDHDTLLTAEEELVHDWEALCLVCGIERQYDATLNDCPRVTCTDTSIIDSAYWILNTTCAASSGDGHAHRRLSGDDEFEWGGVFPMPAGTYTWLAQGQTGTPPVTGYANGDTSMKIVAYSATAGTYDALMSLEGQANTDLAGTCTSVNSGGTIVLGTCYDLQFSDPTDTTVTLTITGGTGHVAFFTEHVPIEFERDTHYLYAGTDPTASVEPSAQSTDGSCCNNPHQIGAFKQVVAYHDLCDHDDIPYYVETGLHAYESNCETHFCNAIPAGYDGTVCPSPPTPPPAAGPETMETGTVTAIVAGIAAVLVISLIFICMMVSKEKAGTPIFTNMASPRPKTGAGAAA